MAKKTIYITNVDMRRLREFIKTAQEFGHHKDKAYLKELECELDRGSIVKSKSVTKDVITMNTKVQIKDLATKKKMEYLLVFPDDADPAKNKISVLSPIGTALLGHRVGDIIEWEVPAGLRRLKVEKILYQPEATGDHHL